MFRSFTTRRLMSDNPRWGIYKAFPEETPAYYVNEDVNKKEATPDKTLYVYLLNESKFLIVDKFGQEYTPTSAAKMSRYTYLGLPIVYPEVAKPAASAPPTIPVRNLMDDDILRPIQVERKPMQNPGQTSFFEPIQKPESHTQQVPNMSGYLFQAGTRNPPREEELSEEFIDKMRQTETQVELLKRRKM
ncbi:hypothetical protein GOP47_0020577 [Adiantum capillus-veneris]|uniref:Uncharacterized protein n=1 Tax=Adiantum capillus-veneris TaxID=13818 RepID=A0A9D4Z7V5_ADICA|nr:hypothetical protein GOP47_0020577 [Adiantum capillus-veneris]